MVSEYTTVGEGALGPLSLVSERHYTEQLLDNQQDRFSVILFEL